MDSNRIISWLRARFIAPFVLLMLLGSRTANAQHTSNEIAFSFAIGGQGKLEKINNENHGFFQNAFLWNLRYQLSSTGIQSFSIFLEGVSETREYNDNLDDLQGNVSNVRIKESVGFTSLGFETIRTLISTGRFRVGVGVGLGVGFGTPERTVTTLITGQSRDEESCSAWASLLLTGSARARYTVYRTDDIDIGLNLTGRYWGFPAIGPTADCGDEYNGPEFTTLHQVGYLAGVSVGF